MGKKGAKAKTAAKAKAGASPPDSQIAAKTGAAFPEDQAGAEEAPPTDWLSTLTPQEREKEEKKKAERQKKAVAAQAEQQKQNEWKQHHEKQAQKQARAQEREDKKWEKGLEQVKQRALKEGILESEDWGDGTWWVNDPPGSKTWKEVQGQYYCTLCEKHLNDGTLNAHMESEAHKKKLAWAEPGYCPPVPAGQPKAAGRPPPSPQAAAGWGCLPCSLPGAPLEDWQERMPDGSVKCLPCGKIIDDQHLAKEDHISRLDWWRESNALHKDGYPAPELPYLAYVPWDENDPNSGRALKCLLCSKWVQDETSHSGTRHALGAYASKEHQKNLRNYGPGEPWYEQQVTQVRAKWHPVAQRPVREHKPAPWAAGAAAQPPQAVAAAAEPAKASSSQLPAGWAKATDPASGREYYHNTVTMETSWDPPEPAGSPPPSAPSPAQLPVGWEAAVDPTSGNTYYYNRAENRSTWEIPSAQAPAAAPREEDLDEC